MAKKASKKKAEALVYIGRTIPGLSRYTVFQEGKLPAHVEQMAKENECIRGLIVPVKDIQEARTNVQKKGHILNFYATHLLEKER